MQELATIRQKALIIKLASPMKVGDLNYLETTCTKEAADKWIKELIAEANGVANATNGKDLTKEYPISFQAFVKAACELYKGTGKTFSQVLEEIKKNY